MEELKNCQLCGGSVFEQRFNCIDYTVSKEYFSIVECKGCGFVFTNPRPNDSDLGKYYKSETYISHSDSSKGIVNKLYKLVRKVTLKQKLKQIQPYLENNKLLDIGCGTGAFLNYCKLSGVDVLGIEPDEDARNFGKSQYSIDVHPESTMVELNAESFSVITMWHVLEHVGDLNKRVDEMKRLLTPNGRIFIAVPNHKSADAQHYRENWAAYDVPRHLHHFDNQSITRLFGNHGMHLENVLPMKFDSFYVSLLSEEIKTGKRNLLKGMYQGLISNLKAEKNTWSSQIYILRK